MFTKTKRTLRRAYSLVEVLVATGVITSAVAAAVSLSAATNSQEEAGNKIARAQAVQENAARLFRLGLSPAEILRLLPKDPIVHGLAITETTQIVSGVGTMEKATIVIEYDVSPNAGVWVPDTWTGGPGGDANRRSATIVALRPSLRAGIY